MDREGDIDEPGDGGVPDVRRERGRQQRRETGDSNGIIVSWKIVSSVLARVYVDWAATHHHS